MHAGEALVALGGAFLAAADLQEVTSPVREELELLAR